jgi:2-aminoadipate transaminase
VEGPEGFDAEAAYRKALERGAAFVPGKYFFAKTGEGLSTMRLNFTMAENPQLERAVRVAGEVAAEMSPTGE